MRWSQGLRLIAAEEIYFVLVLGVLKNTSKSKKTKT